MPMFFLDKRAQVICDELKKESVRQKVLIENWEVKEGKLFMCLELSIYKKCPIHSRSNIILHLSI